VENSESKNHTQNQSVSHCTLGQFLNYLSNSIIADQAFPKYFKNWQTLGDVK